MISEQVLHPRLRLQQNAACYAAAPPASQQSGRTITLPSGVPSPRAGSGPASSGCECPPPALGEFWSGQTHHGHCFVDTTSMSVPYALSMHQWGSAEAARPTHIQAVAAALIARKRVGRASLSRVPDVDVQNERVAVPRACMFASIAQIEHGIPDCSVNVSEAFISCWAICRLSSFGRALNAPMYLKGFPASKSCRVRDDHAAFVCASKGSPLLCMSMHLTAPALSQHRS